ncbi:MAG TPA: kelch repeat-containing protein [Solirubrobacteraceae bacterium]|nr:kelch repeat-containing protein [Solirubrobacteraceae bacterium]
MLASAGSRRRKTTAIAGAAATLVAVAVAAVLIATSGGTGTAGARQRSVGKWTSLTSLATIRGTPDAITLYTGQVLVAGGGVGALATAASELYDPSTGRWSPTGSLLQARRGARAVLLRDDRVLVAGGIAGGRILASAEIFDPVSRRWWPTGSMHVPRLDYTLTLVPDGKVLAAGGASTTGVAGTAGGQAVRITSSAELYNPATGTWARTGSLAVARFEASGTSLPDGGVLIAGGFGGPPAGGQFQPLASTEIYGAAPGAFAPAASMSEARADQDAVALGGPVLVTGGLGGDGSSALASAERYSPTTGTWSEAAPMRQARDAAAAAALPDGYVLVAGGQAVEGGTQEPLASAELYDPSRNRWLLAGAMACPRSEPSIAALAGGTALVLAGDATFPGHAPVAQGCVDRYAPPTAPRRAGNQ